MATPGYVTGFNHSLQDYQSDPNNPFANQTNDVDYGKLIQGMPSLAVPSALQTIGKSQYGPFGSYIMSTVAPNFNNIFDALTPFGADDSNAARDNFYDQYTAGLYNANSPYNVNYGEAGNILKDALSGASDTIFSHNLAASSNDPAAQASQIDDYLKGVGATTMSATKYNLIHTELVDMLSDYAGRLKNHSIDGNTTSFVSYLVSRSADFLDRIFGGVDFSSITPISGSTYRDPLAAPTPPANVPPMGGNQ